MSYDALDDVPWQVKSRRQQQQQQQNSSPTFSIVTDASSPQQPGHNHQVMSPSLALGASQASASNPRLNTASAAHAVSSGSIRLQQMSQMVIPQELLQMLQQLQQHHLQLRQVPAFEHLRNAMHAVASDLEGRSDQLARAVQFQMEGITSLQDHLTDLQRQTAAGGVKKDEMMPHMSGCLEDLKHMQSALQMFETRTVQGLKTLDERMAGLESQMAHIKSTTSKETQRMREHMEQLQVQVNQVVARLEGLDMPTEDGAQTPVGAQTNLMAENLSLLQGEVGQIGRYQRELDVRWDQQRDTSNRKHEKPVALSALERNALQLRQHEETVTKLRQHEETIARHLSAMPESGVSDQGMNTSLPAYAGAEASEQEGRRPPVTQEPAQHTMSSNTPLQQHQASAENEWWNDEAIQAPGWEQPPGLEILSDPPILSEHLQQCISEFTTVASCVALEFNPYFLKQLETAKSRYDARQIQLKPEDIEAPPVPSHCEGMENRLSLTLVRVLPEQLRKPVMEQSAGQRVSSVRMLEGLFE